MNWSFLNNNKYSRRFEEAPFCDVHRTPGINSGSRYPDLTRPLFIDASVAIQRPLKRIVFEVRWSA